MQNFIKIFKYATPFVLYGLGYLSFTKSGFYSWTPLIYVFLMVPLVELFIAPNPTNGEILIQLNQVNEPIHLFISDMQGRILMSDEIFSLEKTINLHHFSSGTYFITLEGLGIYQVVKN